MATAALQSARLNVLSEEKRSSHFEAAAKNAGRVKAKLNPRYGKGKTFARFERENIPAPLKAKKPRSPGTRPNGSISNLNGKRRKAAAPLHGPLRLFPNPARKKASERCHGAVGNQPRNDGSVVEQLNQSVLETIQGHDAKESVAPAVREVDDNATISQALELKTRKEPAKLSRGGLGSFDSLFDEVEDWIELP
ncbi:hypothetical protein NMY22_g589 [Coprinellus aureogranulatus]|nr:hypothetical protein NMY22_g589 [Coprinellus aureogranulatus]